MKSYLVAIPFYVLVLVSSGTAADNTKKFILKDGSTIQAEIISYTKGVYQLRSSSLGQFSLAEDKIKSIQFGQGGNPFSGADSAGSGTATSGGVSDLAIDPRQVDAMKNKIMSDPHTSKMVEDLQKDPAIQQILGDKELMQAIEKGDMGRLANDPKILSLMNNKDIGRIIERGK
jgi:hypothetical protein